MNTVTEIKVLVQLNAQYFFVNLEYTRTHFVHGKMAFQRHLQTLPEPAHKASYFIDPLLLIGPCTGLKNCLCPLDNTGLRFQFVMLETPHVLCYTRNLFCG